MAVERDAIRNWHRLFGLMLTDFFTATPFAVEIERDLSQQQQLLDILIVRRAPGPLTIELPDGLADLVAHNLITFKSHHEALTAWAMKELIHHYVAYRKLVRDSSSNLLAEEQFRLYAVCARFPHNLSSQVPWQQRQPGVYDCRWGTDTVRVIVTGRQVVNFARSAYQQRSEHTSRLLWELTLGYQAEGTTMAFTMEDWERQFAVKYLTHLAQLPPEKRQAIIDRFLAEKGREVVANLPVEERREIVANLPVEERLAGLSADQIRQYLEQLTGGNPPKPRKPRRKK